MFWNKKSVGSSLCSNIFFANMLFCRVVVDGGGWLGITAVVGLRRGWWLEEVFGGWRRSWVVGEGGGWRRWWVEEVVGGGGGGFPFHNILAHLSRLA